MHLPRMMLTALLTLVTTLTISDFPLIQNCKSQIQNSWALAQATDTRKAEADKLLQQGKEQIQTSQFKAAWQTLQQALSIYQDIGNRWGEASTLHWLARISWYQQGIDFLQKSVSISHDIGYHAQEAESLNLLGYFYLLLGQYQRTIELNQQSLIIARRIGDREKEALALGDMGLAYFHLGYYQQAIKLAQQGLAIVREIGNRRYETYFLNDLGSTYQALGQYQKAIEFHQQAVALGQNIGERKWEGVALNNLGSAYQSLGDYAKAIEYQQQSLAIAREVIDPDGELKALNNLGLTLYKQGNLAAAEITLIDGIQLFEEYLIPRLSDADKVSIFETQRHTYRTLQKVLIAQNKTNAALEIAERGRARAFVELLARRLSPNPTEQPSITPPTIEQIKQIAKAQKATLVQYSIIYDDFKVQGKPQIYESELYIWVIKPTGEVTFRRSDLKPLRQQQNTSLDELVTSSRESIGVRGRGLTVVSRIDEASQATQLQQLHKLLIQPITDLLPTDPSARVIFIPQKSLFLVPFAALQDESGKYLIEKHTILTAPSIQVLELTRQQRERVEAEASVPLQDALVVGNPTMPSVPSSPGEKPQQLDPLPGAEREAKAIAPLLNTKAIIGKDATKSAIEKLMPKARIIHLATHGLLDDLRGIGSAIALAPSQGRFALAPSGNDDGLLKAEDILDMKLNAELVVLSACDTGRGRITGDGVIGLSRALITAGVPSVIASLWSVPDAPTASLMTNFYQNFQNNPDKAQALRQAMLTTMKQHPNPRNWAAFTLIGEAE